MITRKLDITDVTYSLDDDARVHEARFFGKTNAHQFMKNLMDKHPDNVIRVRAYTQYEKVYQIEENEFIKIAKEIEKNE